jgi:hypothetical protein
MDICPKCGEELWDAGYPLKVYRCGTIISEYSQDSDIQGLACIVRQTMDPLARRVEALEAKVENMEQS